MPSGAAFLPLLAEGLKAHFGEALQDALILLPTRRAVRELGEAFVGESGASLLPRMRPLADIDPDEPPFEPGYLTGLVQPAISGTQRRFELAKIVAHYHGSISDLPLDAAGLLSLTDPILAILDDAAMEEVSLESLKSLKDIEAFAAEHFQNAAVLYQIIQTYWPNRLAELGMMEPMARRVALLKALTELWTDRPPRHPVIIAGSTGTLRATAQLMRCVSHMPNGMIVLPGLDKVLPEKAWTSISTEHPQNSLKQLISTIGVSREEVPVWPWGATSAVDPLTPRRLIISESLVPVDSTADWPERINSLRDRVQDRDIFEDALDGLSVVEARTDEEEALVCALIMRETLDHKTDTAALITPDPALARRVKARLRRWGVDVDYSQGEPLEETFLGGFLAGILRLSLDRLNPVDLAYICKHPLTALTNPAGQIQDEWRDLEKIKFRGTRQANQGELPLVQAIHVAMDPLLDISAVTTVPEFARALAQTAEALAATDELSGASRLWREDAGEKAASLIEELMEHGQLLGEMTLSEFVKLFCSLMRGRVVRPRYGTHPRLQILGPLEARMLQADRIILGGLNEGVWPAGLSAQPFLSRAMRESLGLSLPERRYGLAAHDFAALAANSSVWLTRSQRGDDGPKVASRWLWRLQTLVKGALGEVGAQSSLSPTKPYLAWARQLDHVRPEDVEIIDPPRPCPLPTDRWPRGRQLSITQFKVWVRDPYSIYARYILELKPLKELDEAIGPGEYGSAIHDGIEQFTRNFKADLSDKSIQHLSRHIEDALLKAGFDPAHMVKERVRIAQASTAVIAWMQSRREAGWEVAGIETFGRLKLADLNFSITGKSDLIEKCATGYAVIDYKTGAPASVAVVQAGFDPQLPLTAAMLAEGAFENLKPDMTEDLLYLRVKGAGNGTEEYFLTAPQAKKGYSGSEYAQEALTLVRNLITKFDSGDTPFLSQPRIQYTHDYGEYDDLARRGEWARLGAETGGEHG